MIVHMGRAEEQAAPSLSSRHSSRRQCGGLIDQSEEKEEDARERSHCGTVANRPSPTSSEGDSATQDSTASTTKGEGNGRKGMNGVKNEETKKEEVEEDEESEDSQPARGRKRGGSQQENGRDAKRCKGGASSENGFPSPDTSSIKRGGSNGEISAASAAKKSLKMKESSRTENGSAMTAVA